MSGGTTLDSAQGRMIRRQSRNKMTPVAGSPNAQAIAGTTTQADTPKNNVTHVDTATATSSTHNIKLQPQPFTYMHDEVQEAQLEGWGEGIEARYKMGKKNGCKEGLKEGEKAGQMKERAAWVV